MLFADAVVEFQKHLDSMGRSPDTVYSYVSDLRRFAKGLAAITCADLPLEAIERPHIGAYLYEMYRRGLAASTRHRAVCTLKCFFAFCVEAEFIPSSPAQRVPGVTVPSTLPAYLELDEVRSIIDNCYDPLARIIASTLFYTGLRISELCSLRLGDLNLDRGTIRVARGKGGKERIVPLNRRARDFLLRYISGVRPDSDSDYLILTPRGKKLTRNWACTCLRHELKRQGWTRRVTPHTFRHSHATALYRAGVGLVTIAGILGHADISTTQLYTHLSSQDMMDAVQKLI